MFNKHYKVILSKLIFNLFMPKKIKCCSFNLVNRGKNINEFGSIFTDTSSPTYYVNMYIIYLSVLFNKHNVI